MLDAVLIMIGCALAFGVFVRLPRCRERGAPDTGPRILDPRVSVIIPARNEAANLPGLLDSLRAQQPPPFEVIVVDDNSTDGTADIARAKGATVVTGWPLPEGWQGKSWACAQGARMARGDVFVFLDADTELQPRGIRKLVDTWERRGGALSVCPYHRVTRWHEQFSAVFNLLMVIGSGAFTLFGRRLRPAGLFGQCLVIDRDSYDRVGGHAAVKGEVLENFALGRALVDVRVRTTCAGGKGAVTMRMYPTNLRDLAAGWRKSFARGAARTPLWLLLLLIAWISAGMSAISLAAVQAMAFAADGNIMQLAVGVAPYALFAGQVALFLRRVGSYWPITAALYPIVFVFYFAVFAQSVAASIRGTATWKGRTMPARSPRKADEMLVTGERVEVA